MVEGSGMRTVRRLDMLKVSEAALRIWEGFGGQEVSSLPVVIEGSCSKEWGSPKGVSEH